jgi:hypothetical protein
MIAGKPRAAVAAPIFRISLRFMSLLLVKSGAYSKLSSPD